MSKKKNKVTPIPKGSYTIYWEEQTEYNNGFYIPGTVGNVRGYQFSGTRQDVALHIKYYLKRKDNLVKVEVTPFKGKLPDQFDSDTIHKEQDKFIENGNTKYTGEKYGKEKEANIKESSSLSSVQEHQRRKQQQ